MLQLALIGLIGGLITGISPCILPVLPVIFFSGGVQSALPDTTQTDAQKSEARKDEARKKKEGRWRPYLVILGLVLSFSVFTLLGSVLLAVLHLPQDLLRWVGLVVLVLIGLGLIFERFQHILELPFSWIPQKRVNNQRGGFVLGIALGAVYVPCAGPVLAAIAVAGATGQIGADTLVLTLTFAVGAALPLLIFALAGRRVAERVKSFRKHQKGIRITGGILMIALAIGLVFNLPQYLQRLIPDYTTPLQQQVQPEEQIQQQLNLGGLVNDQNKDLSKCSNGGKQLESCGTAPDLKGIQSWYNTENNQPVDLKSLHGKVVLIDFWAYSCINCQRSIPNVVSWYNNYKDAGLEVIGVHSPEYAFEKVPANVMNAAQQLGIKYPVAIDNNLDTWTNYRNRYWPAHYLIDSTGTVRHIQFGEGGYQDTENLIRQLLTEAKPGVQLPAASQPINAAPEAGSTTQETYLGANKRVNFSGTEAYDTGQASFAFPANQANDSFALQGKWNLQSQYITPTAASAQIKLNYHAKNVFIVVAGEGTLGVEQNGTTQQIKISGVPTLYQIVKKDSIEQGQLTVNLPSGLQAYSFTYG
ncbi:cytochrome c biogenesis protein DipZ [Psychromicrobium sp. YIM B11713]|uniref:cytochrome c biogenesis protein DipZ n=1 Tax=Psychromicrobium sp. YIM B11713 TaxID=3145233 RepID=UPI00374FAC08